jgi:hypothetical protein
MTRGELLTLLPAYATLGDANYRQLDGALRQTEEDQWVDDFISRLNGVIADVAQQN